MISCPVCDGSGRVLVADVYSTLDGDAAPCWETAQEMVCSCQRVWAWTTN